MIEEKRGPGRPLQYGEPQTTHQVVMPCSLLARLKAAVAEGRAAGGRGNVSRLIVEVLLGRYPKEGGGPD